MPNPEITVLMPVYNGEEHLAKAIESILNQTLGNFKLLVINDGSTDGTSAILKHYSEMDDRIMLHHNKTNLGLISTLNIGLSLSKTSYILRMDADDIALPNRLGMQLSFMDSNGDVQVSGGECEIIGGGKMTVPEIDSQIRSLAFMNSPLLHPTVIMRRSFIENHALKYDPDFKHAEDYALWVEVFKKGKSANINKPLIKYRKHQNQVSQKFNDIQRANSNRVRLNWLNHFGISLNDTEADIYGRFCSKMPLESTGSFDVIEEVLTRIIDAAKKNPSLDHDYLKRVFSDRLSLVYNKSTRLGGKIIKKFRRSRLMANKQPNARFLAKAYLSL